MHNDDFTNSLVSFDYFVVYAAFIDTRHIRWLGVPGKLDFRSLCSLFWSFCLGLDGTDSISSFQQAALCVPLFGD